MDVDALFGRSGTQQEPTPARCAFECRDPKTEETMRATTSMGDRGTMCSAPKAPDASTPESRFGRHSERLLRLVATVATLCAAGGVPKASAQELVLGPELPVDPQVDVVANGPIARSLFGLGTGYLLVGDDNTAIRLNPDGTRLDLSPFPFAGGADDVACSASQCLAVWSSVTWPATSVQIQRLALDGTAIDATPVILASIGAPVSVAWTGDRYLVAWGTSGSIFYVHVGLDGSLIESAPVELVLPNSQYLSDVDCDSSACLLVFREAPTGGSVNMLRAVRVANDGTLLDPEPIDVTTGSPSNVNVVSQGDFHLVYWSIGFSSAIAYAARVSSSGTLLDPTPLRLAGSIRAYGQGFCHSTGCLVSLLLSGNVPGIAFVDASGIVTSPFGLETGTEMFPPAIACDATGCLTAYAERGFGNRLTTLAVSPTGRSSGSPLQPVLQANRQALPRLIAGSSEFLAAWLDSREATTQVRAVRVGPTGALAPDSDELTTSPRAPFAIGGAFGGGVYFVSWVDSGLQLRRVLADGAIPDSTPIALGAATSAGAGAAFGGSTFLFTWVQSGHGLIGQRLSPIGATIEPTPFMIGYDDEPSVAWNGTEYMVIGDENRTSRELEIYGKRVTPDGAVIDALAFPVASADGVQRFPQIAWGDGQFLAVWADGRDSASNAIFGARVAPDGTVIDLAGFPISATSGLVHPAVTWNGREFVVAWSDTELVEEPPGSGSMVTHEFVSVTRIGSDGALLDPTPVRTEGAASSVFSSPSLASLPDGTTMVAYTRYDDTPGVRETRVFVRLVTGGGWPCATDAECPTGFCAGSVCCDRACDGACEACSVERGAERDGVCGPAAAGVVCRLASGDACDVDEVCDGLDPTCPDDVPTPSCGMDGGAPTSDGGIDAGGSSPDAGSRVDAGSTVDAGTSVDAGVRVDAGSSGDAGSSAVGLDGDIGVDGGVGSGGSGGCSATGPATPSRLAWAAIALIGVVVRRRRARRASR